MNIRIHSAEINRMMKTVSQCIDPKSDRLNNIEVICDNDLLTIRSSNGQIGAVMTTQLIGAETGVFCVDGAMFARVCSMCKGEITISTEGRSCTIRGAGKTRLPVVDVKIPAFERVTGKEFTIRAEDFLRCYGGVAFAVAGDIGRLVLTGVLTEFDGNTARMVSLDGFRLAVEETDRKGPEGSMIIPGTFMKLIASSVTAGEEIVLTTDGKRIQAETSGMLIGCGLLTGEYPAYRKLLPETFKTECAVNADALRGALKSGSVINNSSNLVKIRIDDDVLKVMSNSEQADFEAEVACEKQGDSLEIAFNQKYLTETLGSIDADEIVMKFNAPTMPCVMNGKGLDGLRMVLPVRVM